ncbi:SPOR domain-containing protein [Sansalvadorimonas sp. 2012CJ34-2]|uniref:SPOR domain-containing protein n=1 Tax=Parendozoicomonas callyspongiae TaxID=2942213 RepID=A0ABT0PF22_9GAMM|nr:SPOR domain-containing protein [Sansalvadorimonas sp. 2012CJ34-2]MCL6269918.1 SPOR domain-containing protein [Sansalvadorimonas sp. 2012CJ34-2]
MAGSRKKRTGARRKKTRAANRVPARLWLAAGVAISALIFGLNNLLPHLDEKPDVAAPSKKNVASSSQKPKNNEPVFDFYTLLPESEVLTPGEKSTPAKPKSVPKPKPVNQKSGSNASQVAKKEAPVPSKPAQNGPPVISASKGGELFLLQAGSFRSSQDAERLRVRLILSGYEAKIARVSVRGGEEWHRVQVGPYDTRSAVDKAKTTLASQGLDTMLLRQN